MRVMLHSKALLLITALILFLIPFFWLEPGEMDLGGDSSRLYFYDPFSYLNSTVLYAVQPFGFRPEEPYSMYLPYVVLLSILKFTFQSSWFLITITNSAKLVIAFLAMYGIIRQFLSNEKRNIHAIVLASLITGIFYVLSPVMVRASWDKAIMSQNQFFLNPLMFYILLRYIRTSRFFYLLVALLISFIFSGNFSWGGAPPFFAFYPLVILYLLCYQFLIQKKRLYISHIFYALVLFIGLHAFHLMPLFVQLLNRTGTAFGKGFSSEGIEAGMDYFLSTAVHVFPTKSWLGLPQAAPSAFSFDYIFIFIPFIIVYGFILNSIVNKNNKVLKRNYLILLAFFLISLFLVTANITNSGLKLYKSFFAIPGFLMFRNYYGQWMYVYTFFMTIVVGFSLYYIFVSLKKTYIVSSVFIILVIIFITSSWSFIKGDMVNIILNPENPVKYKVPVVIDKDYENALNYIANNKADGKILTLPLTETYYQMLAGTQMGMYQGPSTVSYIANKADFVGYQTLPPFSEVILQEAGKKDVNSLSTIFSFMNIGYIFYNSDPQILDHFKFFPYQHVKTYFPNNQKDYSSFIDSLPVEKVKSFSDKYHLYQIDDAYYLPHIYTASAINFYDMNLNRYNQFRKNIFTTYTPRSVYLPKGTSIDKSPAATGITFKKINPTKYYIEVNKTDKPFLLVFSDTYSSNWQLFNGNRDVGDPVVKHFKGEINESQHENKFVYPSMFETIAKKPIATDRHFVANGYANAWLVSPKDLSGNHLILEMVSQRYLYIGIIISSLSFIICVIWLAMLAFVKVPFGGKNGKKK